MTRPIRPGHAGLVGTPLVLVMIFCFALVMTQSHEATDAKTDMSTSGSKKTSLSDQSKTRSKLSTVSTPTDPSSQTNTTSSESGSSSSNAGPTSAAAAGAYKASAKTTTPQPAGGAAASSVQHSSQNHQQSNPGIDQVTQPVNQVIEGATGLLRHD